MAYSVHLTRKATSWASPGDPAAITLAEWVRYVASDPELTYADFARSNRESQPDDPEEAATCVWVRPARQAQHGEPTVFRFVHDHVSVADPDPPALDKLLLMAQVLHARVQGDDNVYFDEGGPLEDLLYSSQNLPKPARRWDTAVFHDFQTYPSPEAAQPLLAALDREDIAYRTEHTTTQTTGALDASFGTNQNLRKFVVQLSLADFERAQALLDAEYRAALDQLAPDHYLFSFTDEELFDLLAQPDEWSALDVALAGQLLRQRGRDVSPDTLRLLRQRRVAELARPAADHSARIVAGYLTALLGGVLGIVLGADLYFSRRQLPSGQYAPTYSAADRVHGLRILVLGAVMFLLLFAMRLLRPD